MQRTNKNMWWTLAAVLMLPLVSMFIVPFYDTSEPRYAEIARIMAQSGDWITPWFSPGVPFWGKPPLSFWAQALSMKAFGFTEFAARLPSWLCLLLSNGILIAGLRTLYGVRTGLIAALIYSSCTLVYISSGAVLTDPFLALGVTLSLVSFAVAVSGNHRLPAVVGHQQQGATEPPQKPVSPWWQYGFFLGLVIGLLAKGPLAMVLSFAPILAWYAFERKTVTLMSSLPWGKGLALVAVLSLPWYILAEIKTPGFLNYFIIGEHFRRFLDPGWAGDLYGSAHKRAYGTIWIYWIQASFPWGLVALTALVGAIFTPKLRAAVQATGKKPLFCYWLSAAVFTPLFFTFAANILWTYILPALAGFSVVAALLAEQIITRFSVARSTQWASVGLVPVVVLALGLIAWTHPEVRSTERGLVHYAQQQGKGIPLLYLSKTPFSARFYSSGAALEIEHKQLKHAAKCGTPFYLAIPKHEQASVAEVLGEPLNRLYANKRHVLVKISPASTCTTRLVRQDGQHTPVQ